MVIQQFRLFPEQFTKFGQPKYKLFFDTKERKKNKKSKKNCKCSENQIEVAVNLSENYVESDIIGDRVMLSRNSTFDVRKIITDFERIVKEREENNENNI